MYFTINNVNLYYEKYGNKKNVLLIFPGWGDNRKTFDKVINILKEYFTIYIFDYPGFGNTEFPNIDLDIYDYSKIFIQFIKQNNIESPLVIGHSFGGRIIITMSGFYNIKFKKIVLIDSAGIKAKKSILSKLKQLSYKILKKIKNIIPKKYREKYLNKLVSIFGSNDYKSIPDSMKKTFINIVNTDLSEYLKYIISETLIIWGEKDIDTPLKDGYIMNELINDSGLIVLKNASHYSYLEYSDYIIKILLEFLKEKKD